MSPALRQFLAVGRRSIMNVVRQPAAIGPTFIFPLMFLAMSSAALNRATEVPGFPPVDSFFQFLVTTTLVQGALFGSVVAGSNMAADIEDGFFDRLIASPVARSSILLGRLMGAALLGYVQSWWFLGVATVFGLQVEGGLPGMLVLTSAAAVIAAGIGSLNVALALRTGSREAVEGSFPMFFSFLFISSAFFPRDLMSGWFKAAAGINPLSHLIEGLRTQVVEGFSASNAATALGFAFAILIVGLIVSGQSLQARLGEAA